MRFLHLSSHDHGGAGLAAWRMHDALRSRGHTSTMLVQDRRSSDSDVLSIAGNTGFRVKRWLQKAWLKASTFPEPHFQNQQLAPQVDIHTIVREHRLEPDIIVVHFISHFLSFKNIALLHQATGAPVLWSLLDMGLLTGGCHYAWDCDGYTRQCGMCPALRHSGSTDASARAWTAKSEALRLTRGWVLAGSSLLARQARVSRLFGERHIETLLLSVSPELFSPEKGKGLREELDLPIRQPIIFFGAQSFEVKRKGMEQLLAALELLAEQWPTDLTLPILLSAGEAEGFSSLRTKGFQLINLGRVPPLRLAQCYAAADVFACPSIEDSGPMMINEAMMSGTPVVAFRMGVADDLIEHGVTGMIAPLGSIEDFATGLIEVLSWRGEQQANARERCRATGIEKCHPQSQIDRLVTVAKRLRESEGLD